MGVGLSSQYGAHTTVQARRTTIPSIQLIPPYWGTLSPLLRIYSGLSLRREGLKGFEGVGSALANFALHEALAGV